MLPYVVGLGVAFAFWANAFVVGRFAVLAATGDRAADEVDARGGILIASCTGLATLLFAMFWLAWAGWFRPVEILESDLSILGILAVAAFARGAFRSKRPASQASPLVLFVAPLREALEPAWICALGIAIVLAYPASIPPEAFDATLYHYAHAVDWAHAGALRIDEFLRFPLAQFNFELLYAVAFALHLDASINFIPWMLFAWTTTGIASLVPSLLEPHGFRRTIATIAAILATCVFALSPITLRYATVGYVDIPAGALLLGFAAAMLRFRDDFCTYAIVAGIIGGTIVGTKTALIPMYAVFAGFLMVHARRAHVDRRALIYGIVALTIASLPWPLRGLVAVGDPIDPVLNLALHHHDPFWSALDLQNQASVQRAGIFIPEIPVRYFLGPGTFEYGASLAILLLYAPFIACGCALLSGTIRRRFAKLTSLAFLLAAAIVDEFFVSDYQSRYSLAYFGVFVVFLTFAIVLAVRYASARAWPRSQRRASVVGLALVALMLVPSPGAVDGYAIIRDRFSATDRATKHPKEYLAEYVVGYAAATDISHYIDHTVPDDRVLNMHAEALAYYFRALDVMSVGDWFGPGRYRDYLSAYRSGKLAQYLETFRIGAVLAPVLGESFLVGGEEARFYRTLCALDFRDVTPPGGKAIEFVRASLARNSAYTSQRRDACEMKVASELVKPAYAARVDRVDARTEITVTPRSFVADPHEGAALSFTWHTMRAHRTELRVNGPAGSLFSEGADRGHAVTGKWVLPGERFYLQDTDGGLPGATLAIVRIVPLARQAPQAERGERRR